jgi:hypothetical protein
MQIKKDEKNIIENNGIQIRLMICKIALYI